MMLGEEIRAKRLEKGWSRRKLVEALAEKGLTVHRNTIVRWEGGQTEPKYSDLVVLRSVLGIRVFNGLGEKAKALD